MPKNYYEASDLLYTLRLALLDQGYDPALLCTGADIDYNHALAAAQDAMQRLLGDG